MKTFRTTLTPLIVVFAFLLLTSLSSCVKDLKPLKPTVTKTTTTATNAAIWTGEPDIIFFSRHGSVSGTNSIDNDLYIANPYAFMVELKVQIGASFTVEYNGNSIPILPPRKRTSSTPNVPRGIPPANSFSYSIEACPTCISTTGIETLMFNTNPCGSGSPTAGAVTLLTFSIPYQQAPVHGQSFIFNLVETGTGRYANTREVISITAVYYEPGTCNPVLTLQPPSGAVGTTAIASFSANGCKEIKLFTSASATPALTQAANGIGLTGQLTQNLTITGTKSMRVYVIGKDPMKSDHSNSKTIQIPATGSGGSNGGGTTGPVYKLYTFRITCPGLVQTVSTPATDEANARTTLGVQTPCVATLLSVE